MSLTVANHSNQYEPKGYINYPDTIFEDIPDMVTNGTNYCACRLKDNYRLDDNFDGQVDVLIIDVDEICSMEQAKEIFKSFEFYLIPSKSHQKDKGGVICDRFRLFFRLDKTIHIREHMEQIYIEFVEKYPFIDSKCKNVSRFYFSSPRDSEVYYNEGKQYPTKLVFNEPQRGQKQRNDKKTTPSIPSGVYVFNFVSEQWVNQYGETLDDDRQTDDEVKLKGISTYLDSEFYQGNKSQCLFNASCMMRGDGFQDDFIIDHLIAEWQERSSGRDRLRDALQNIKGGLKT